MNKAHTGETLVSGCAGSAHAAPGVANWLGPAAAPTFAIMALWSAFFSSQPDTLCMAMQGSSPMSDMTLYLLMSVFHAAPWLRLIFTSRRTGPVIPLGELCSSRSSDPTR